MNKSKTVRTLAFAAAFTFIFAIGIFAFTMYLEERIGEYDTYSMLGFLIMLLLLPISIIIGFIAFKVWLSQQNKVEEFTIYQDRSDTNEYYKG